MTFDVLERTGEESVVAYFRVRPPSLELLNKTTKYLCQHCQYLEIRTGYLPTASRKRHRLSHPAQRHRWTSHKNLPRNRNRAVKLEYKRSDSISSPMQINGCLPVRWVGVPLGAIVVTNSLVLHYITSRGKYRPPEQYSIWRTVPGGNWPDSGKRIEKNRIQNFTLQKYYGFNIRRINTRGW